VADPLIRLVATSALVLALLPTPASTQPADDAIRFGISFGGIGAVALNVEFMFDSRSIDVAVGTWSFRDVSFSAVGKQYIGDGAFRGHVGAGLWMVVAAPGDERTGMALVLRAPIGFDWEVSDPHAVGAEVNINRGLWVRRPDPEDDRPMNRSLPVVPVPGLYYRFER